MRVHARKNYATVEIHPKAGVRKAGFDCNVKRALRKETSNKIDEKDFRRLFLPTGPSLIV